MDKIDDRLLKRYDFESEQELMDWAQTMNGPEWTFPDDYEGACLYTDSDGGIAEITYSEMFDDDGFAIRPINCFYVDFKALDLLVIYRALREEWRRTYEKAE